MHAALQFFEHREQLRHFSLSKVTFSSEKRARNDSAVPTGQMVLQYVRPLRHASTASMTSMAMAMPSDTAERSHTSTA